MIEVWEWWRHQMLTYCKSQLGNKVQWNCITIQNFSIKAMHLKMSFICQGILFSPPCVNSLWLNDAIWRHITWSTLVPVIACCLEAPSHYPNPFWLLIKGVLWQSHGRNSICNMIFKINTTSPRSQWVHNFHLLGVMIDNMTSVN